MALITALGAGLMAASQVDSPLAINVIWATVAAPAARMKPAMGLKFIIIMGAALAASMPFAGALAEAPWLEIPFLATAVASSTYLFSDAQLADGWRQLQLFFVNTFWIVTFDPQGFGWSIGYNFGGAVIAFGLLVLFENVPHVRHKLQTLHDVGLDYIKLGQASPTLSGGEAQRIKLARELVKKSTGKTLYLLDEPTTGLHFADVKKLLEVLNRLVEAGNTVVVIEHNLDVVKTADWVIDLGPEGGARGGEVVAAGTPEQVAEEKGSYTGQFLGKLLAGTRGKRRRPAAA